MAIPDFGITDGSLDFRLSLIQHSSPRLGRHVVPEWFQPVDWLMTAARMMSAGWDGDALSELAGEGPRTDVIKIRRLVERAVAELGLREPRIEESIWCVSLIQCALSADGQVSPRQVANTVVALTRGSKKDTAEWQLFLDFAEGLEWDDVPEARPTIEKAWKNTIRRYNDRHGATISTAIIAATNSAP